MRGYVGVEGHQVHYRSAGEQGPAVVLFHESPQASNVYERALPHLGKRVRAWAFDTPGYGLSDPPAEALEIPGYAALLLEAVDELGIEDFAVLGQHTGASIALEVARAAGPGRVTHAVLSGLTLFDEETRARYLQGWAPDLQAGSDGHHLQDLWTRYLRLWESPPELVNLAVTNIASVLERYNWAYNAAFRHDPADALASLECPVMLLTAARDLLVESDEMAMAIRPDAVQVRRTDTTGQLPWRIPDEWAGIVADFVMGA